jgi:hypothetical protein
MGSRPCSFTESCVAVLTTEMDFGTVESGLITVGSKWYHCHRRDLPDGIINDGRPGMVYIRLRTTTEDIRVLTWEKEDFGTVKGGLVGI